MPRRCEVRTLDLVSFKDGLDLQAAWVEARKESRAPDTLLLLEHPPTVTLGRGARAGDILVPRSRLESSGIEILSTNRGGRVTVHGPGQLVVYPILDLQPDRCDAHRYLRDLEEVVIRTLAGVGISAHRLTGLTGVWVGNKKIASIGVHLCRWITSHGIAINVTNNLRHFDLILPCGLPRSCYGVTSMKELLGRPPDRTVIGRRLADHFGQVFNLELWPIPPDQQSVQVLIMSPTSTEPLFLLLKRTAARGGFWQPVTGIIEPGESPRRAAVRELLEETGIGGRPRPLGPVYSFHLSPALARVQSTRPQINREYTFLVEVERQLEPTLRADEHTSAAWLNLSQALKVVNWESTRRALDLAARSAAPKAAR